MNVTILFPGRQMAQPAAILARALRASHRRIERVCGPADPALALLPILFSLERVLGRANPLSSCAAEPESEPGPGPRLRLDLGPEPRLAGASDMAIRCNGAFGLSAIVRALLAGQPTCLSVVAGRGADGEPLVWAHGRICGSRPRDMAGSLNEYSVRLGDLVAMALRRLETGQPPLEPVASSDIPGGSYAGFALRSLSGLISSRIEKLVCRPEHWSVRWRATPEADLVGRTLNWPAAGYRQLPDDGARYYADPFLCAHEGRTALFVEEFSYATGRGLLSVADIRADGSVSVPRPFLDRSDHLSYPHVFEHDGRIWMIPETSQARTVELYRCVEFPDRWERESILLSDVDASDATFVVHGGRCFLLAALHPHGSSARDMLGIFVADSLLGPWRAHPATPAVIDVASARPAGAFFRRNGQLMRVAQDGEGGYGAGMTICRIDRLDDEGFSQSIVTRLKPQAAWKARGVHTLNAAAGYEVIDTLGRISRSRSVPAADAPASLSGKEARMPAPA